MKFELQFIFKLILILNLYYVSFIAAYKKYNVTMLQMTTCKEYEITTPGYSYKNFFLVHNLDNNKLNESERLHLKFYVFTAMDAHILLSVNDHPHLLDRVYEIVIGAGSNTFSAIRLNLGRRRVVSNQDPHLLSEREPTPIEIVQKKDGQLLVYIPGYKKEPLLVFLDRSPLTINYVSFSTFGANPARWFYDCGFDGFENEIELEKRILTPTQLLINAITEKAENKSLPTSMENINFAFEINAVSHKQDVSLLYSQMNLILYWNDMRLQWDPTDFNEIKYIKQPDFDIWLPHISVLNGAFLTLKGSNPKPEISIYFNGNVSMVMPNAELKSWCGSYDKNWPNQVLNCDLLLAINEFGVLGNETITLTYDGTKPITKPVNTLSEWKFIKLAIGTYVLDSSELYKEPKLNLLMEKVVKIEFTIEQNGTFYKNIYTMPILASETLLILSFLLRGYRRGALILVVFIVLSLGLMFITKHAPAGYVPNILIAYKHVMRIATTCYLLHVIVIWLELYPPKNKPCETMMNVINSTSLRFLLCMRFSDSNEYLSIQQNPWREISKILNSLSFIIINVIFILIDVILISKLN